MLRQKIESSAVVSNSVLNVDRFRHSDIHPEWNPSLPILFSPLEAAGNGLRSIIVKAHPVNDRLFLGTPKKTRAVGCPPAF